MNNQQQELQISEFIKDPTSLKLLILAGTNISPTQLLTVSKCISLIKLDLSSNMLAILPLKLHHFQFLKIMFLHDNFLENVEIKKTTIQYLTLFENPINNYRTEIIENNPKILGIDYNMITDYERIYKKTPEFSQLKWPLVEISSNLENEDDYLNLLKAQIFVVNNLNKRTKSIQTLKKYLTIFKNNKYYGQILRQHAYDQALKQKNIKQKASKIIWHTQQKIKLRSFLKSKDKQYLIFNRLEIRKYNLSPKNRQIVTKFVKSIRQRMVARKILERNIHNYKQSLPAQRFLNNKLISQTSKIYLKGSQIEYFEKICLYIKKILFKIKDYDACDNFDSLVKKTGKQYIVYRDTKPNFQQRSWLLDSIHQSLGLVIKEENIDRKHLNYTRKGHKFIGIKNIKFGKPNYQQVLQKSLYFDAKLNELQHSYDHIVEYAITNSTIFQRIIKLIRYFNAGNNEKIVSNKAAYFQTQIQQQYQQPNQNQIKLFLGIQPIMKRVIAACIIQRSYRKYRAVKKSQVKLISTIKQIRAKNLISRWINNIIFIHRISVNKTHSYMKNKWRQYQLYMQLDIYMNLPTPTNLLRIPTLQTQDFYQLIHKDTQIQMLEANQRKWLKVKFSSAQEAYRINRLFILLTYRYYYNGFSIRLLTQQQMNSKIFLQKYEQKIEHLYKIEVKKINFQGKIKTTWIQSADPYFVWPDLGNLDTMQGIQGNSGQVAINMFIYNKHKRPLKVSCDLKWINTQSIYKNKKRHQIIVRSAKKIMEESIDQELAKKLDFQLPRLKMRQKRHSVGNRSLINTRRSRNNSEYNGLKLLSETISLVRK